MIFGEMIGKIIDDIPFDEMPGYYPVIDRTGMVVDIVLSEERGYVTVDFADGKICNIDDGIMAVITKKTKKTVLNIEMIKTWIEKQDDEFCDFAAELLKNGDYEGFLEAVRNQREKDI